MNAKKKGHLRVPEAGVPQATNHLKTRGKASSAATPTCTHDNQNAPRVKRDLSATWGTPSTPQINRHTKTEVGAQLKLNPPPPTSPRRTLGCQQHWNPVMTSPQQYTRTQKNPSKNQQKTNNTRLTLAVKSCAATSGYLVPTV